MISFLVVGDFGDHGTWIANHTNQALDNYRSRHNVDGVLALGDNFYERGVASEDDPKWKEFEATFKPYCPWYAVLGNHDYLGDPEAQVRYSRHKNTFWTMPHRFYDKKFYFTGDKGGGVHLICLDTFELSLEESKLNSLAMGMSMAHFHQIHNQLVGQWQWLEKVLEESREMWKVVIAHYPVYSSGPHGDNPELIQKLEPILRKHRVDLYLSGHDHHVEHQTIGETQYILSGAGSRYHPPIRSNSKSVISFPGCGAAFLEFHPSHAVIGFLATDGKSHHSRTILPNHSHPPLSFVEK